MSNEEIIIKLEDQNFEQHTFTLISKVNNQNGGMIYTFREEGLSTDFTINKDNGEWHCVRGDLPYEECVYLIGEELDSRQL